jgi:hypothetical protein
MLMRSLSDPRVQAAHALLCERVEALAAGEPDALEPALAALAALNNLTQPRPMPAWFRGVIKGGRSISGRHRREVSKELSNG